MAGFFYLSERHQNDVKIIMLLNKIRFLHTFDIVSPSFRWVEKLANFLQKKFPINFVKFVMDVELDRETVKFGRLQSFLGSLHEVFKVFRFDICNLGILKGNMCRKQNRFSIKLYNFRITFLNIIYFFIPKPITRIVGTYLFVKQTWQ